MLVFFIVILVVLWVVYVVDVFIDERYNMLRTKLSLLLSFIVPFYLWFLIVKDKWHELD